MADADKLAADMARAAKMLDAMLRRARAGDQTILPVLRKVLVEMPSLVGPYGGDLAARAEGMLIAELAGDDLAQREAIARRMQLLREELAGPAPTAVERLLVERVVITWLLCNESDMRLGQPGDQPFRVAEFRLRKAALAQRRHLSALKALVQVRKLALPALQLNVADQQIVLGPEASRAALEK